jgi:alpha-beta hydrolase superfamily lysophospholipase
VRRVVLVVLLAAAIGASAAFAAPASTAQRDLPHVLRFVDTSRTITLPHGKTVPRPVTTVFWYPPLRDGAGPFPLVVFGHGFASTPWLYRRLLRDWAAAGYVVAAPVFPLGNANAPGGPDESDIVNQPRDMSFVITRVLKASAGTTSPLSGLVDPEKVAVAGHSDGAMTAFAAAYEKPFYDDRIHAALVLSGAILGPHRYVEHTGVPLLAVQGTADRINQPIYARELFHAVGRPKFLLLLRGAGHLPPYTVPGPRFATVMHVTIAFLDHYLGNGSLRAIGKAARQLPTAQLTSYP